MPRQPCNFRKGEITRALKGAEAAGFIANRIDIDKNGTITLFRGTEEYQPQPPNSEPNEWDESR